MPLTDFKVRQTKPTEKTQKLADGGALYLVVKPNGAKLWWYRYVLGGKENVYSIGEYPEVSLLAARKERDAAKLLVKVGKHPGHIRRADRLQQVAANANTFQGVAEEWLASKDGKVTPSYIRQVTQGLTNHAYPAIGKLPIADVKPAHVLAILQSMEKKDIHVMAEMVRQWCSLVFRYAVVTLRAESDPAGLLKGLIRRPPVTHARPLSEDEIRTFWAQLAKFKGHRQTAIALELMLYLFVRTIEIRRAEWPDLDMGRALWTIPAEKMKRRRTHVVPLPRQAVALLEELASINGSGRWMFPNTRKPTEGMSATTVNRALDYMGFGGGLMTGHDFRATASTHLHSMGYRSDYIEMQLAHVEISATKAAYNHAQYLPERRRMLQDWADWLDGLRPEVAAITDGYSG